MSSRQARTLGALMASLQTTAGRGGERLARLERVLNSLAADAAEPDKVRGPAGAQCVCVWCWGQQRGARRQRRRCLTGEEGPTTSVDDVGPPGAGE
jgi:hypothetical protein